MQNMNKKHNSIHIIIINLIWIILIIIITIIALYAWFSSVTCIYMLHSFSAHLHFLFPVHSVVYSPGLDKTGTVLWLSDPASYF